MRGVGIGPIRQLRGQSILCKTCFAQKAATQVAASFAPARSPETSAGACLTDALRSSSGAMERTREVLARSERFELPTLGFEVRCSIQLSYERVCPAAETCSADSITR